MATINWTKGAAENVLLDSRGRWSLVKGASGVLPSGTIVSATQDFGNAKRIQLRWIAQWTAPLHWQKHPGNPIYGPIKSKAVNKSGAWDSWTNGVSIVPTVDGKGYRMYYSGDDGEGIGFAEASIQDPLTWKENPASPVLKPLKNWEGNKINQPRVVILTPEHWLMYYTGWGFKGPGSSWAMGIAESFDSGTTWKRWSDKPFLERGDIESPDGGAAMVPMVLRVGERWMMWYTGVKVSHQGHDNIHLCLATSNDAFHWDKYTDNPVLTDDFSDGAKRSVTSRCFVRHDDGVFRMWYSFGKPGYCICYAESLDGIAWEKAPIAPVLGPSRGSGWDSSIVEYPEVQIVDGLFRLWFCGNGYGKVGYAQGKPETGVHIHVRTGDTREPDASWTHWLQVEREQSVDTKRYIQVRGTLWSHTPMLSPTLNQVAINIQSL